MDSLVKVSNVQKKAHKICIEDKRQTYITGIDKVISANETNIEVLVNKESLRIIGSELQVNKFDVSNGDMDIMGNVFEIKYGKNKNGIFKRFFK